MSKRRNEYRSIEDLMKDVIKENKLTKGLNQLSVKETWAKLMGAGIVAYTNDISLNGKTLIVKMRSSVLRD